MGAVRLNRRPGPTRRGDFNARRDARENERFKRERRRWARDLAKDVAILVENTKRAGSIALESILGPRDTDDLSTGHGHLGFHAKYSRRSTLAAVRSLSAANRSRGKQPRREIDNPRVYRTPG